MCWELLLLLKKQLRDAIIKLLLLLITLTTLTNVSYASFPVTEDVKTELIENKDVTSPRESVALIALGFFLGLFSPVLFLLPLLLLFIPNKSLRIGIISGFSCVLLLAVLIFWVEIFGYPHVG